MKNYFINKRSIYTKQHAWFLNIDKLISNNTVPLPNMTVVAESENEQRMENDTVFIQMKVYNETSPNITSLDSTSNFTPLNNSIHTADDSSKVIPVTDLVEAPLRDADSNLHRYKIRKTQVPNSVRRWSKPNNLNKRRTGQDERYDTNNNNSHFDQDSVLLNITHFIFQMELLTKLESQHLSQIDKMLVIEEYKKNTNDNEYIIRLKSGSLFKDWDFEMHV